MSARLSASGKPASFPTKAYEFFASWAASRAEHPKGRKFALPALLYSHLPGAPVALQQCVSSMQARSILSPQERR